MTRMRSIKNNLKIAVIGFSVVSFRLMVRAVFATLGMSSMRRFVVLLLIASLLMPFVFLAPNQIASAQQLSPSPATPIPHVISAPPQPFVLGHSGAISITSYVSANIATWLEKVVPFFSGPQIPQEFNNAKAPTASERFLNTVSPALGLSTSTEKNEVGEEMFHQPAANVDFDFDGDGKTDMSRWQPSTQQFRVRKSSDSSLSDLTIGTSSAAPAPGDFDGDNSTDRATFNAGLWTVKQSSTGSVVTMNWGMAGDKPVPADYDGDGRADYAIYRPSTNTWWIYYSKTNTFVAPTYGSASAIPVQADYDGDGKADIAYFDGGTWYVMKSGSGATSFSWGLSSDVPVPADYDGDGKTDYSVFRPATGTWWIHKSSNGTYAADGWGNYEDQPVPGDYDGDNKADLAIWRETTGAWYISKSSDNGTLVEVLGQGGDVAVPSAYVKNTGGQAYSYDLARQRLSPKNATGGINLYSRNFGWDKGLVSLPGRAGLDAGIGVSYNSLVWVKEGNDIYFDQDNSNISPGFRMGFPVIEPVYYDSTTNKYSYMMTTPSGGRVEFRQTLATNVYETADSTYLQLKTNGATNPNDPTENITITVYGTDGNQMTYTWKSGAFYCSQIKDRNGNYLTVNHSPLGFLTSVTDTLGRVVTVNYDSEGYPTTITQTMKNDNGLGSEITHTHATFAYATKTVSTDFDGMTIYGPPNGAVVKVLDKVTYADGFSSRFDYNGYLQVWKIRNYAPDNHLLNYTRTNLESPAADPTDCPRLAETRSWVENFNNGAETVITNTLQNNHQVADIDGNLVTAAIIQTTLQDHPTGNITNTYVGQSGWMEGLSIRTDDYANGSGLELKRSSFNKWTQDNVNVAYPTNPRVIETKISDSTATKRTTVDYLMQSGSSTESQYGLPQTVQVYDADLTTVIKKSVTTYNLASDYINRRIIGLPLMSEMWGKNDQTNSLEYVSKVTYAYDEEDFTHESNQNISNVIQHDNAAYSASFVTGRGNPTSTTRHDVTNATSPVTSKLRYDIAGSPVAQITPWDGIQTRKMMIEYTDVFNDTINRNTYAYPTKIYDPAGNFSQARYRFDIGSNVWGKSPAPAGQTIGKETAREYDTVGRVLKETIVNSGAYTRYDYPQNGVQSQVFSTMVDVNNNNTGDTADEVLTESWTDGAGRVRQTRTPHTFNSNGTTATWAGTRTEYDLLGRVKRASVPTEVDSNFDPAGDDLTRGYLWTVQKYDWNDRVVRKINTDGLDSPALNDSDVLITYEGCGCAGGQVTTVQGENIVETDWQGNNPVTLGRRTQKIYEDALGRTWKTEILNWNGSVYTRNIFQFNGRDQITSASMTEQSTLISQVTTNTYDGHGRLKTQHEPIQDANVATSYDYYHDDQPKKITDARGAAKNFVYNNRGFPQEINFSVPQNSTINVPQNIGFSYDNAGNRVQMTDETGTANYQFDQLSQMSSETKSFTGVTNTYSISYTYGLSGKLKSMTNPDGTIVSYAMDKVGRLTGVNGQGFTHMRVWQGNGPTWNISQIASAIQYRAWGNIKHAEFQDGRQYDITYDDGLRPYEYTMPGKMSKRYRYYADGKVSFARDMVDNRNDRSFSFDQLNRITKAYGGYVARSESQPTGGPNLYNWFVPIKNDYVYNGFSNPTERKEAYSRWYMSDVQEPYPYLDLREVRNYTNNRGEKVRPVDQTWVYDADGRFAEEIDSYGTTRNKIEHNAAGLPRITTVVDSGVLDKKTSYYDGNGAPGRELMFSSVDQYDQNGGSLPPHEHTSNKYFVRSSVLKGAIISPVFDNGNSITQTNIYAEGRKIATYHPNTGANSKFIWEHSDPNGVSGYRSSYDEWDYWSGAPNDDLTMPGKFELAPNGLELGSLPSLTHLSQGGGGGGPVWSPGEIGGGWETNECVWDGVNVPCGWVAHYQQHGGGGPVVPAPAETTASIWSNSQKRFVGHAVWNPEAAERGLAFLGEGSLGWLPSNVSYTPGSGLSGENIYQWFGGWNGGSGSFTDSTDGPPTFISERSAQMWSSVQGATAQSNAMFYNNDRLINNAIYDSGNGYYIETKAGKDALKERLKKLLTEACAKAFKDAGLQTPEQLLSNGEVVLAAKNIIKDSNHNNFLGISEANRKKFSNAPATTIQAKNSSNGKNYILIFADAFNDTSGDGYPNWFLAHEFIHAAGVGIHRTYAGYWGGYHDLSNYEHYDNIIKNCGM